MRKIPPKKLLATATLCFIGAVVMFVWRIIAMANGVELTVTERLWQNIIGLILCSISMVSIVSLLYRK